MVELSRSIASKIKDKQGDITEDEVRILPTQADTVTLSNVKGFTFILQMY